MIIVKTISAAICALKAWIIIGKKVMNNIIKYFLFL